MSEETNETTEMAGAEEDTWNLVLFPRFAEGEDPEEVKKRLSTTLKVDASKVEAWYHAEAPTLLLKGVAQDIAQRYMDAILQCGATCNIQRTSESGGLSLVPKSRNMDFFICPSCQYEEEIPKGTRYEQCPKCGLVIAKWEEKMKEEREKEAIRRRLMRDARHKEDREGEEKRKREELERLRGLEREIMRELGMKPPGKFWLFFEQHTWSMSSAFIIIVVAAAVLAYQQIDHYLQRQKHAELLAAQPSEEIQTIAPAVADAVNLQQNGNQAVLSEMATITSKMRGQGGDAHQQIVAAAQQMMKGADSATFVDQAAKMNPLPAKTRPGENGEAAVPVNTTTLGGITGLKGVDHFEQATLARMTTQTDNHGSDQVLHVLGEKRMVPDPQDPKKQVIVDEIDQLDGSMVVKLMNSLQKDQEWDQFLRSGVDAYLAKGEKDKASDLIDEINGPAQKVGALGDLMLRMLKDDPAAIIKVTMEQVHQELAKVTDPLVFAQLRLDLGERLGAAGYSNEPGDAIDDVSDLIKNSKDQYQKALLSAQIAVVQIRAGDQGKARAGFGAAVNIAGSIKDPAQRISAFTRIAKRYYDARDTALANKILSEAQVIAATQLATEDRSRAFGEIAIAQGYLGDIAGALASIDNAATGDAVDQLKSKLAESLIDRGSFYQAQSVMDGMADEVEYNRLEIRMIGLMIHSGQVDLAKSRLTQVGNRARKIEDGSSRGLVLSAYGRLMERLGEPEDAKLYFDEALGLCDELEGRKKAANRGLVALNEARALMFDASRDTMEDLTESIVRDPIQSEVLAAERITKNMLPESMRPNAKKS